MSEPQGRTFWDDLHRSAELVRGLPSWTQAGLVLSDNFVGGVPSAPSPRDLHSATTHDASTA